MDTVPFNLILFAVDFLLLWALAFYGNSRIWAAALFFQLLAIGVVSKIFRLSWGHNLVEGLFWHTGFFLVASGGILYFRQRKTMGIFSAIFGLCLLLFGFNIMIYEPYAVAIEHYEIRTPKVDKPLRIVFIADTQTDNIGAHENRVYRIMKEQNPDLIILGGDYIQAFGRRVTDLDALADKFCIALHRADFKVPLGVYAIRGNNDATGVEFQQLFKDTVVNALENTQTTDLGPIVLTTLGMHGSTRFNKNPLKCLDTDELKGKFHVMAGHVPTFALEDTDADLLLAGHTHGGQIRIPFYGPIMTGISPKYKFPREWASGWTTLPNGSHLLVTRGTGMERGWAPQIRFNCRPEISVIDVLPALQ